MTDLISRDCRRLLPHCSGAGWFGPGLNVRAQGGAWAAEHGGQNARLGVDGGVCVGRGADPRAATRRVDSEGCIHLPPTSLPHHAT